MFIGIDGCRKGWIAALIDNQNKLSLEIITDLAHLKRFSLATILIDMPIGFPEKQYRQCEIDARILLGTARRSSVFFTPHKKACYANSHSEASSVNRQFIGKGISIQTWNICEKVKLLNRFVDENKELHIRESHPELCFYVLNNYQAFSSKKSTHAGIADRTEIIAAHAIDYLDVIADTMAATKRSEVKIDDMLDATVMAIRASTCALKQVPANSSYDGHSIFY